ncbi:MAG: pyruvate kinase [Alphaproteobacteria bacterium]
MQRRRSTKILATLGPASDGAAMIRELVEAGADAFRLNFSHGTHADHRKRYQAIRRVEKALEQPIAILADLQGPKIRVGTMQDGEIQLTAGRKLKLVLGKQTGDAKQVALPHPEVFAALDRDMPVLLDDGKIRLRVLKCGPDYADTEIVTGGPLRDRKGVNLPDATLPVGALSDKDRADLAFAMQLGVDWLALSFVQRPDDIAEARKLAGHEVALMAKIEKPQAVERIDEILDLADGLMVARGDLGVEVPLQDVPVLQKRLVRLAHDAGKPVVIATQMLESMITAPAPTRAEVSDVATAVYDGADAVMLSAETAAGAHPVAAVTVMNDVAEKVESDPTYREIMDAEHASPEGTAADAITAAARQVAETIGAAAIACYTTSGSTALRAARERPRVPILVLTPKLATARRLALAWGLHCIETEDAHNFKDMVDRACDVARLTGLGHDGQRLVITAGVPFGTPGATNILRIAWIGTD